MSNTAHSPSDTNVARETEWAEVKKGWAYQRRRHMLVSTQWSPRWLVLYSKPIPAIAIYEQKGDSRPPYTPLLHLDLASVTADEVDNTNGRASGTSSYAHSRCGSVSGLPELGAKKSSKWTDKLISRIDSVKHQLKSMGNSTSSKQALEDHMLVIQKESGEKWTFGFECLFERAEWIKAISELQTEIAMTKQLEGIDMNASENGGSRRDSSQADAQVGLQAFGITVLNEQNMLALLSSTPPEFQEFVSEDPKLSKISVNEAGKGSSGPFDDLNQLFQLLLSERRNKAGKETKDAERVNDLSLLKVVGSFNQLVGKKIQDHIDNYHQQPAAVDGLLFDLHNGLIQVELVVQYEDGPMERDVAFGNSVVRHELHSLQMINSQRSIPAYTTLMSVLEYKGFRILAYWALPLSADTLMLREVEGDPAIVTEQAVLLCKQFAEQFGFMVEYPNKINGRPTCLHTGIELHAIDPDLVKITGEQAARARVLPRGFYMTAMSDMLPQYSLDPSDPVPKRFRPELIKALSATQTLPNADNFPEKTSSALKALMGPILDDLVKDLEELRLLPLDSIEWTRALHSRGINISLFGELYKRASLPHVKEHILIEMASRAFKCVLGDQLRLAIRHFRQVQALKVEPELQCVVLEWIEQLVVKQKGRWIDELLIPLINVKFRVRLEAESFKQLSQQALFLAMQHHAGLLFADKDYEFTEFAANDFVGFRVREVSSSFRLAAWDTKDKEGALYNIGLLTLPMASSSLWKDLLFRAELSRRFEKCGLVSTDQKLLLMAENVAPSGHIVKGLVKLHQLSKLSQPVCSTSSARSALHDIRKTTDFALALAEKHLGSHHPIVINIRQDEYDLLQRLQERLKISSTSKGNPMKEVLDESLACRQQSLATSIRVLGRSHAVTKNLIISIGELHLKIGNLGDAISFFQDALKIAQRANVSTEQVKLLLDISRCYQKKGELDTALRYSQDALKFLQAREQEVSLSSEENSIFDACYQMTAELALLVISNGETVELREWEDQQFMSVDRIRLVSVAADCYEQLYERIRTHPEKDHHDLLVLLRKIVALKFQLARPAQKTMIAAARRAQSTANENSRSSDLYLKIVSASSPTMLIERILDSSEQNPCPATLDELRLLILISLSTN